MSIFDVFSGGSLGSVLNNLGSQAKSAADSIRQNTPGGVAGLAGAGALGALLGSVFQGDLMKNVALAGAGAVAWNFYKKWAAGQKQGEAVQGEAAPAGWGSAVGGAHAGGYAPAGAPAQAAGVDPTAELVMRAMIYAARADGTVDATEQERMNKVMQALLPGQDVSTAMRHIMAEPIDPAKIAAEVRSPEQAEDVYRLSCSVIDIDHFMEVSYLQALAKALNINDAEKTQLENEAGQAKRQLMASVNS